MRRRRSLYADCDSDEDEDEVSGADEPDASAMSEPAVWMLVDKSTALKENWVVEMIGLSGLGAAQALVT